MAKLDITPTELVWPAKYNEGGTLKKVLGVGLPFQVVETVNETHATCEVKKDGVRGALVDVYEGKEKDLRMLCHAEGIIGGAEALA
jgi:hypothetical protein